MVKRHITKFFGSVYIQSNYIKTHSNYITYVALLQISVIVKQNGINTV